jgi:hypothetical protein
VYADVPKPRIGPVKKTIAGRNGGAKDAGAKTASTCTGNERQSVGFSLVCSQIPEVAMSIFSYRKHLRFLTHSQRRRWWDQRKRLTPRVKISGAYVPPSVTREFTYVKVG